MKNKSIKWYFNYFLIGFINNLRNSIKDKRNDHYRAYKSNRKILVNTYNPEDNWNELSLGEKYSIIGDKMIENKMKLK